MAAQPPAAEPPQIPKEGQESGAAKGNNSGAASAKSVVIRDVTWESSPSYDGDKAGVYLFTPILPDNYYLEDESILPEIRVEVTGEEKKTVEWVLAGIEALPGLDSIYENMPGDADPEFEQWLTDFNETLDKVRAIKAAYDALSQEEKGQIGEESFNKLMELVSLADSMSGIMMLNSPAADKWTQHAAQEFAGGSGTREDPYQIANAAQLAYMATDAVVDVWEYSPGNESVGKYYKITVDTIDLSPYEWIPISTFAGSLDGGGCTITGMYCREPGMGYGLGLFGIVDPEMSPDGAYCEITDLHFEDCTIESDINSSNHPAGILAGAVYEGSRISGCTVRNSTVTLTGKSGAVGGLVGYFGHNNSSGFDYNSVMTDCHVSDVAVENDYGQIGGLIGGAGYNLELIEDCTVAEVTVTTGGANAYGNGARAGGLVGAMNGGKVEATVENCNVTGESFILGKANDYTYGMGGLVGYITNNSPYETLTVKSCNSQAEVTGVPAGQRQNGGYGGLIGTVRGGNRDHTATVIDSCTATGNITSYRRSTGGLVGSMQGTIKNCYSSGDVFSEESDTGGLVGSIMGIMENSYATGSVTGGWSTGGLAGYIDGAKVRKCYAVGHVTIEEDEGVGGLIGRCETGLVEDCYAMGDVTSQRQAGEDAEAGGLIGSVYNTTVRNCYSKGRVVSASGSADLTASGLIGTGTTGTTVTNCYYDKDTSGQAFGYQVSGSEHEGVSALDTQDMTHPNLAYYLNVDGSNDTWTWERNDNEGYPYLGLPAIKNLTYKVEFRIRLDGGEWVNSGKSYRLTKDGGATFTDPAQVTENGAYDIYEGTLDTGVDVTVSGQNLTVDMDYYTVSFYDGQHPYTGGGAASQTVIKGGRVQEPPKPVRFGNEFTGWYGDEALTQPFDFSAPVTEPLKIYASWSAYGGISGTVKDKDGPVSGVTVEAREGGTGGVLVGGPVMTDLNGAFQFTQLPSGVYSLVLVRNIGNQIQIITRIVQVEDTTATVDIFMPEGLQSTVVEVVPGTPPIAADKLDALFSPENLAQDGEKGVTGEEADIAAAGGTVEIKLIAQQMEPTEAPVKGDVEEMMKELKDGARSLVFSLTVEKTVTERQGEAGSTTRLTELPEMIDIYVPIQGLSRGEEVRVLRVHGSDIQELPYGGEYFEVGENYLLLHLRCFSTYMIAFEEREEIRGGGDSSDFSWDPGLGGRWILDDVGWWYQYSNGTWPSDGWYYLYWNDRYYWYHFNKKGYIDTGWFTDSDGTMYYLHPYPDGKRGYMYTGWNLIDGSWYYFETEAGRGQGMLYVSRETPDGYWVDENGRLISSERK